MIHPGTIMERAIPNGWLIIVLSVNPDNTTTMCDAIGAITYSTPFVNLHYQVYTNSMECHLPTDKIIVDE